MREGSGWQKKQTASLLGVGERGNQQHGIIMSEINQVQDMTLRDAIRAEIAGIAPLDTLERSHIDEVLAWIDSGAELCRTAKPATPPEHLVSYFACVDGDHILLVDHRNARLWLPTGGHVEPGEHPRRTVAREALEELGIAAEFLREAPLMITRTGTVGLTAGHTDISLWYLLSGDRTKPLAFDEGEFRSVRWFRFTDVPLDRSDPHMERFLRKLASTVGDMKKPDHAM